MADKFELQELAIALVAQNLNPTAINVEVLKYSGIVPADWELAQPPVYAKQLVKIIFANGVGLVAQQNRIVFVEAMQAKGLTEALVPELAQQYVERFPNLVYQAVGINPKAHVQLDQIGRSDKPFVVSSLLQQGVWQDFGVAPVNASVQISYTLERGNLNIVINDAALQQDKTEPTPVILFAGNFNTELLDDEPQSQLTDLKNLIASWQNQVLLFQELIETRFIGEGTPSIPAAS